MSIDREFRFLNQSKNSLNDGKNVKVSVNKGDNKPSKMVNFVKDSSLKYLICALLLTGGVASSKIDSKKVNYDRSGDYLISMEENDIKFSIENANKIISKNSNNNWANLGENPVIVIDGENRNKNYISSISFDEEFGGAPGIHILQTTKENLYLTMNGKLSIEDYQEMFKGLKDLQQGAIGNCYFVVALKNLARSKYFDTLMMSSIEKIGDDYFNIYMPLGEPGGIKITITKKDLDASTLKGSVGYKILQIGFAKYLLFKEKIIPNTNVVMTDELIKKTEGGISGEAMQTFLGPKNFKNKRIENNSKNKSEILDSIKNFNPNNLWIISASSKIKPGKTDQDYFKIGENTLYYGHAYLISCIEKEGNEIKYITLNNPWNNKKREGGSEVRLTLSEFFEAISAVHVGSITENFLNYKITSNEFKIVDSVNRK